MGMQAKSCLNHSLKPPQQPIRLRCFHTSLLELGERHPGDAFDVPGAGGQAGEERFEIDILECAVPAAQGQELCAMSHKLAVKGTGEYDSRATAIRWYGDCSFVR